MDNFIILNASELDKINGGFLPISPDSPLYQWYKLLISRGVCF